jgi:hypothetical protein
VADSTRRSQSPHTGAFGLKREPIEISDEPRGSRPGSTRGRWCNSTGLLTRLRGTATGVLMCRRWAPPATHRSAN